jgi:chorismate-pyruvate lyase
MSRKFQITLPEELSAEMKTAASRMNMPLGQFIRQTMQEKLREVKAAKGADPFAWMDGLAETEETDLASRIDEILHRDASVH